jgi:2-iminobutanoate/2-iminopropanoate deaminase
MANRIIKSTGAPAAIGPYSQGVMANGLLFLSGQIPLDPVSGEIVGSTGAEQARRVLMNMSAVLESAGVTLKNVVKTTVFMIDLSEFQAVNQVYAEFFPNDPPARSAVQVAALPRGARVEIEAVAVLGF